MSETSSYKARRIAEVLLAASLFALRVAASEAQSLSPAPEAQAAEMTGKTPVFDVATIKPNNTMSGSTSTHTTADMFWATNLSLPLLLEDAFGIKQNLISGLPGWAQSAHYDIVAKIVDGDVAKLRKLTREQRRAMLQQLLADRFQLKSHIETKALPVFELVVAKGGILFKERPASGGDGKSDEGTSISNNDMTARNIQMESLVNTLTDQVGRKVIDKTGLTGRYDLHMKWQRDEDDPSREVRDDSSPSIFAAVEQQLGLKLESAKGPVDTLVVDWIAMPSEN